jgi:hypothetical protein
MQEDLNVRMDDLIMGETTMRSVLILASIVSPAFPLAAEVAPQRPKSCERIATAQYDNCSVTNLFRCTGEGFAFWVETVDAEFAMMVETRDATHSSLHIDYVGLDTSLSLTSSSPHPRDIVRDGSGADSITGSIEMFGLTRPVFGKTRYDHSGKKTLLAEQSFARIDYDGAVSFPPPMGDVQGSGSFLYNDALDLLIEEETRFDLGAGAESYRLARLSLPGQKGFADETPGVGCGEMSHMTLPGLQVPA